MATLEEIRAKLKQMEDKRAGGARSNEPSLTYPFWNIPVGESVSVRLLPDADPDNVFFWKERQLINLTFAGVKGGDENRSITIKVPCVEMWGDTCPVTAEIRPWWNDTEMKETARRYWKKRSYFFQGFVNQDPLNEAAPENPIRRFIIGPQIFNIIKESLSDPDMLNSPTDYLNGTDFRIQRTKKGEYSDYSTSKWARQETALSEEQAEQLEKFGLFKLEDWMPARPTADGINAIREMFEASLAGELYDPAKWANYYRPYGLEWKEDDAVPAAPVKASAPAAEAPAPVTPAPEAAVDAEVTTAPAETAPNDKVKDMLARLKSRQTNS
jgi:hypothetical protein